ncbi:MAG TPA: hypothetical protein GX398_04470 [Candidatus Cloacimonetes bacterium]|nr:hypothetical protein [Candidatus Cloacimonadota bacterium]
MSSISGRESVLCGMVTTYFRCSYLAAKPRVRGPKSILLHDPEAKSSYACCASGSVMGVN